VGEACELVKECTTISRDTCPRPPRVYRSLTSESGEAQEELDATSLHTRDDAGSTAPGKRKNDMRYQPTHILE